MRVDIALQGPKSRDTLFAMGVDDLLTKPFKLSELAQRANRLVNS